MAVDQLVLVVAKSHEFASLKTLERDHVLAARWVLREKGSGTRQVFEDALRSRGIDPAALDVVMELPSNEAVRSVVEAGAGATVSLSSLPRTSFPRGRWPNFPFTAGIADTSLCGTATATVVERNPVLLDMMRPTSRS